MALRWELDNVWPCCRACHEASTYLDKYEATLLKTKGVEFVDGLRYRGRQYCKAPSEEEVKTIIEELTYKLTEYGNK